MFSNFYSYNPNIPLLVAVIISVCLKNSASRLSFRSPVNFLQPREDPPNITRFSMGFSEVSKVGRNYLAGEFDW